MGGVSAIGILREIILEAIRYTAKGEWKVLILDGGSRKVVESAVKEDDILKENVISIEQIEQKRPMNTSIDALYLLSPEPHIVDCLMADFERRRYRRSHIIWTSLLRPELRGRIEKSPMAREQIAQLQVLNIDFFPSESHLITFRDPWSFPMLYHPACNPQVRSHMDKLAQKIVSVCVSLGEYPVIRYYHPLNPTHEASVLCTHLARFVQDELDQYAKYHEDFPPASPRPRGALLITDRSMDPFAPLIHEFTYQAMIHDLLPIKAGETVYYKTVVNQGEANEEEKDMEINEKDKIWVENRHLHMKDLLEKLVSDFNKFRADNPQFAESGDNANSLNNIKDMLAGLPQFQQGKEAYSLHLNMAQESMSIFQKCKLADIASVEQSLATGLDEDYKKPKTMADQVVRLLDDEGVSSPDRIRLIMQYLIYRGGLFPSDITNLLAHARLPPQDGEVIHNLDLLGVRVNKPIKDAVIPRPALFGKKALLAEGSEDSALSRFEPAVKVMLEEFVRGVLDQNLFPFTKPHLDATDGLTAQESISQASLRSAKPTWARTRPSAMEPRQRIIVFVAGGATYSESRACYEISRNLSKDVFLATSHMVSPGLFLRQVGDLSVDKRRLDLPADRPRPKAPAHLFEREPPPPKPRAPSPQPPTATMNSMNLNAPSRNVGPSPTKSAPNGAAPTPSLGTSRLTPDPSKLSKKDKEPKEKTKRSFFGSKK